MAHYTIHTGDNQQILDLYPNDHFDAIVTDPPYGIEFLGKDWDQNTGAINTWRQCLRVLKPGGHLLAFSAARTYHHLASNIESVGFEIRDQLMWLYASGFPKAQDVGKSIQRRLGVEQTKPLTANGSPNGMARMTYSQSEPKKLKETEHAEDIVITSPEAQQWSGWKTALKPAHEPIVMARKPFKGSTIDNVIKHGVGALNIDDSRIPYDGEKDLDIYLNNIAGPMERGTASHGDTIGMHERKTGFKVQKGRVKRPMKKGKDPRNRLRELDGTSTQNMAGETEEWTHNEQGRFPSNVMGEIEGYQKYFYCPKVSRRERHTGFDQHTQSAPQGERRCSLDSNERLQQSLEYRKGGKPDPLAPDGLPKRITDTPLGGKNGMDNLHQRKSVGNNHPTVKPVALMRYLIQLIAPKHSVILDPFTGSGSTGMAAVELGHRFVGCELDSDYVTIAKRRIEGWCKPQHNNTYKELFEDE